MTSTSESWRVVVVTGTRAEFGLLEPVMRAIKSAEGLELLVLVTGTHLLPELNTVKEVAAAFHINAMVPMQASGEVGRSADVTALGRGVVGLGQALDRVQADLVLVLGDRIEALAAASAASVGGRLVAHVHGGDRAEGIADEAMRHAVTKLAHVHFPATSTSADRIVRMGEPEHLVFNVGSPAIDDLDSFETLPDEDLRSLGVDPTRPFAVVLQHPTGQANIEESEQMTAILRAVESDETIRGNMALLRPNHDPGREGILEAIGERPAISHLDRDRFIGLLKRARCLIGNSSAGLIEAAALGLGVLNIGARQNGRERAGNVIDVPEVCFDAIRAALARAADFRPTGEHPYGDGSAGRQIAQVLRRLHREPPALRKRNTY